MDVPVFHTVRLRGRLVNGVPVPVHKDDPGPSCSVWSVGVEVKSLDRPLRLYSTHMMALLPKRGLFSGVRVYD